MNSRHPRRYFLHRKGADDLFLVKGMRDQQRQMTRQMVLRTSCDLQALFSIPIRTILDSTRHATA
jgi:hypothetical protein